MLNRREVMESGIASTLAAIGAKDELPPQFISVPKDSKHQTMLIIISKKKLAQPNKDAYIHELNTQITEKYGVPVLLFDDNVSVRVVSNGSPYSYTERAGDYENSWTFATKEELDAHVASLEHKDA